MNHELNPNHKTTKAIHDHWHKIVAVIMHKLGHTEVHITAEDMVAFSEEAEKKGLNVAANDKEDGLHIMLVDNKEAQRIAEKEGGLPHGFN